MGISDVLNLSLSEDEESDDFVIVDCLIDVNDSMMVDSDSEKLLPTHFDIQEFQKSYMGSGTDMAPNFSDGVEVNDGNILQTHVFMDEFYNPDLNPIGSSDSQMSDLDSESYMYPNVSNGVEVNDENILQTHFFINEFYNPDLNPIGSSDSQMPNLNSELYTDFNDSDGFFIDEFFNPDLSPIGSSDSQFFEENVEVGTHLLEQGFGLGFGIEDDDYCYDEIIDDSGGDDNRDGFFERNQADDFVEFVELFDPLDTISGDGQIAPIDFESIRGTLPAAKSVVQNLPTVILKIGICAVCQDEISLEKEAKCLPCTHHYHGECILSWLGIRNTCPICRFELPTDDPDYEHWRRQRGT